MEYQVNFPCIKGILLFLNYKTNIGRKREKHEREGREREIKEKRIQKKPVNDHETLPRPYKSLTTNFVAR